MREDGGFYRMLAVLHVYREAKGEFDESDKTKEG